MVILVYNTLKPRRLYFVATLKVSVYEFADDFRLVIDFVHEMRVEFLVDVLLQGVLEHSTVSIYVIH